MDRLGFLKVTDRVWSATGFVQIKVLINNNESWVRLNVARWQMRVLGKVSMNVLVCVKRLTINIDSVAPEILLCEWCLHSSCTFWGRCLGKARCSVDNCAWKCAPSGAERERNLRRRSGPLRGTKTCLCGCESPPTGRKPGSLSTTSDALFV